ncbi:YrzK family protein [Bacillus altitudinis]|uniref:YrzK family protein n=1 Tax=Bacillus TaxID=1386 RepID=UPI000B331A8A|nr:MULTISPECIES: YrzK family protein [Bacillus]MBY0188155.1 YrzK family protein [Bacillus aerophilus]MBU8968297.1 YrzK family protein [Bacillus altitudinis]MCW4356191.1 YrzK family protein [Bacillus altitudinis]MCY7620302.1 YrzK family protein [Bacillus altitudinis]MDI6560455.1 YrzK family protein [Bacillus altitudinis]
MRLSRKLGRVQYNGHRDIDRWQHDEMDQPGFLEEAASEYGCTSKEELEKKKRHGKG